MSTNSPTDSNSIDPLSTITTQLSQKTRTLKLQADQAESEQHLWEEFVSFAERNWSLHLLEWLRQNNAFLEKITAENETIESTVMEIKTAAEQQRSVLRKRFPALLEQAAGENKLDIDRDSRHPHYTFYQKFFTVEIDDAKGMARLVDYESRLAEFPADVNAVVEYVSQEHRRLFGRPFEGEKFINKLRNNYLAIIKRDRLADGTSVPIRQITRRLGKNEDGFRTDEFSLDLSRLIVQGPLEIDGMQIDLQQTKDTHQGMLLHGLAGRGYIGFVLFRRLKHE